MTIPGGIAYDVNKFTCCIFNGCILSIALIIILIFYIIQCVCNISSVISYISCNCDLIGSLCAVGFISIPSVKSNSITVVFISDSIGRKVLIFFYGAVDLNFLAFCMGLRLHKSCRLIFIHKIISVYDITDGSFTSLVK